MGAVKTEDTQRNKVVRLRCSDREQLEIQQKAEKCGMSMSDLIRISIGKTKTWTVADKQKVNEFLRELSKIGNNLNQLTRYANTNKEGIETLQILGEIGIINEQLEELKEAFFHEYQIH